MRIVRRIYDWDRLHAEHEQVSASRGRSILAIGVLFCAALTIVLLRVVWLEVRDGPAYRDLASRPIEQSLTIPGLRGRIITRDGTVLAADRRVSAVALNYRWLEEPPQPAWLKRQVRKRLSATERRRPDRCRAEEQRLLAERADLHRRLASLCGLAPAEWRARVAAVQARVARLRDHVNQQRLEDWLAQREQNGAAEQTNWAALQRLARTILTPQETYGPPAPIAIQEELDYHVVASDVPLAVVAEIEGNPVAWPGARIVEQSRRRYPHESLAAHVVGYVADDDETAGPAGGDHGVAGVEARYEAALRGEAGQLVERLDPAGRLLSTYRRTEPRAGRDVLLTIDAALQRSAESLLAAALERRGPDASGGGAIIVMHAHGGAVLTSASAPAFRPAAFAAHETGPVTAALADPRHPLLNRAIQMQIPPGSVFKLATALALLEQGLDPDDSWHCQGYLNNPESQRCAIFTHTGQGHGEVDLRAAIAQSCNVYFFRRAADLGLGPLLACSRRLGFGRPTGIDLPAEAWGSLPAPNRGAGWQPGDTQSLAIGQASLMATPIQIARLYAVLANGGRLVTPHVVGGFGLPTANDDELGEHTDPELPMAPSIAIDGVSSRALEVLREALVEAVDGPGGTAGGGLAGCDIPVAGKTGTAEAGGGRPDHAWFAGFVPADSPKYIFVVALEHAGDAATAAVPVGRRLVEAMDEQGLLGQQRLARAAALNDP